MKEKDNVNVRFIYGLHVHCHFTADTEHVTAEQRNFAYVL